MNERIKELRKQVSVDMHLHNIEDIKAMEGCFGLEGGNKIFNDYMEKFAELIIEKMYVFMCDATDNDKPWPTFKEVKQHFGVEE